MTTEPRRRGLRPDGPLAISNDDWNRFCSAKGIGRRPCPVCGALGQIGAFDAADPSALIVGPQAVALVRGQQLTQQCDNCGRIETFALAPIVDWLESE